MLNTSPMIVAKLCPLLILCSLLGACVDDPDEETLAELPTETTTEAITSPPVRLFHALAGATRGTFVSSHSESTRTIHIAYAIARAQGPEKGAIVVSNGRTETFEQYAEIVEDLTLRGYTLYLFDHRGQGRSDRVLPFATVGDGQYQKGSVDDFDDYVDDLQTFIVNVVRPDRVGKSRKLYGLGHSMGGAILSWHAMKNPTVFDKLVLSSPMFRLDFDHGLGFQFMVEFHPNEYAKGGPWEPLAFNNNALTSDRARLDAKQAVFAGSRALRVGGPTFRWADRALEVTDDVRDNAEKLVNPVLIFSAAADRVVEPEAHHAVCSRINAVSPGRCKLVNLPTSRHEPLFEVDAIRTPVLDRIVTFLQQP